MRLPTQSKGSLKTYFYKHKIFLVSFGVLVCLLIVSAPLFRILGHNLVGSIYRGESISLLNNLIEDQSRRPLDIYFAYADTLFNQFQGYLISLLFLFTLYFLFTLLSLINNKTLQNIGILLLVLITIFGLSELLLRYLMPVQIGEISFANYQPSSHPDIIIEPRPNAGEFNSDGFRDEIYTREKPEGVYRIIVIGDSLAYGLRVPPGSTYAKRLEGKLNELAGERRYEVINMGVPGYRTIQTIARLEEKGLTYNPDMIIYGYWLDDISFSGLMPFYFDRANLEVSELINRAMSRSPLERTIKKILLQSQIVRRFILLTRGIYRQREYGDEKEDLIFPTERRMKNLEPGIKALYQKFLEAVNRGEYADLPGSEPYYTRYTNYDDFILWNASFRKLSEICRDRGISCLLLLTPVIYDYKKGNYAWEGLHQFIKSIARHYAIPSIDLTEEFCKYAAYRLRAGDLEHPSKLGHKIIADRLHEWIVNEGY